MGVSGGGDLLYSLKNLGLAHLVSIATSRAAVVGRTIPTIDIDANWLIRKYFMKSLLGFDFHDGARMTRSEVLTAAQRVQIADLFASLLVFHDDPPENLKKYANVLPKTLLDFANGARADDGYRLMQRCIRHAMDSKTEQIIKARGEIIEHNGVQ